VRVVRVGFHIYFQENDVTRPRRHAKVMAADVAQHRGG